MPKNTFAMTPEEYAALYTGDHIIKHGLEMNMMEGIWLAWETDPEAVAAALPPVLQFAAPIVMAYIVKADTEFAGAYNEACMIVPCAYEGRPGAIQLSILLEGPGAPMASCMGREMAGMPKKACDSIIVEKNGDTAHGAIIKDGVTLLDCSLKLGSYNTPAGEQMFGANVPGNVVKNDTFLLKYDLEQADDGHMYFDNGRVLVTHSNSEYEYWMPASAEVTLTPCNNAPWASLPVKQVLAAGFGKYKMDGFTTERIGDMDTEENMPWLLKARYDDKLFG